VRRAASVCVYAPASRLREIGRLFVYLYLAIMLAIIAAIAAVAIPKLLFHACTQCGQRMLPDRAAWPQCGAPDEHARTGDTGTDNAGETQRGRPD